MRHPKPLVALLLLTFLQQLVFSSNLISVVHDEGENVTLVCPQNLDRSSNLNWIIADAQAKEDFQNQVLNHVVQDDGSLLLENVSRSDSHLYTCQDAENNQSLGSIKLQIKGIPSAVNNFTAITHSVYALVTWNLGDDGGYPIKKVCAQISFRRISVKRIKSTLENCRQPETKYIFIDSISIDAKFNLLFSYTCCEQTRSWS